ncbi:MAG: response regulator [Verrucomicrobia bacterium]|nr:response regulator [Verrucomicrobiota bacterium]
MAKILLADDDAALLKMVQLMLRRAGHEVTTATNGNEALRRAAESQFDLVLTDLIMPDKEGIEVILALRKKLPGLKVIAMSGGGRVNVNDNLALARTLGAAQTLAKPFSGQELLAAIEAVLGKT